MNSDVNLVPITSPDALYQPLPPGVQRRDYDRRTPEQIAQDLKYAHKNLRELEERDNQRIDTINKLIREKDNLQKKDLDQQGEINALQKKQRATSIWTAVAVTSVAPVWAFLLNLLYLVLTRHQ